MLALALTADLTGVTDLLPVDTKENPYFYTFKIQCTSCRETHPNSVSISRFVSHFSTYYLWHRVSLRQAGQESNEMSGSRGEANFVWKCKSCKILTILCLPLALLQGEWMAKGLDSPTKFSGVDLQEGEWFDYDEKAGEEVSIKDLKWEIRRA
ncbi:hypothetical protein MMC22_007973 [Lobaria immixta]|nr:hypothetical protein [Lobaria immixta]